ncbi:hypothetical protein PGTUg99_020220 [Puccinia graminis f. sp. tritici]|uniref:Zinc finger double-stranded RNA binding domain-containing protein n=1 Tax=Puccinia graminis f. sp. tritici TaxID=56615 RepID=A0A5B0Q9C0_PUCGR|nr:hypothetical protein PGTUg99_020220 [Puccinia graminis f. sp. tritici]
MITLCRYECKACHQHSGQDTSIYECHLLESGSHHYCKPCQREFGSAKALQAHLNKSQKHMRCRWCQTDDDNIRSHNQKYHTQCPRSLFTQTNNLIMDCVSTSALMGPSEAGTCPSGGELEDVDEYFGHHCDPQQWFVRKELIFPQRVWEIPSDHPKHKNCGRKPYICPSEHCAHATFHSLSSLLLHRETRTCEMGYRHELPKLLQHLFNIVAQL